MSQKPGKPDSTGDTKKPATEAKADDASRPLSEKIGFSKLDLSVEEVEERISPRETNVFDK